MALLKTAAIILNSRRWGEADRIVTFYSDRFGKLRAVARGARKSKGRFGAALEPFVHCDLNLFEKHGDSLYRLTQADIRESFAQLTTDLALMAGAARMVNLVSAITVEGDPDSRVFDTLLQGLRALRSSDDPVLTTLWFQVRLLSRTGFRPQTEHCAVCGGEQGTERALFSPRSGGRVCLPCADRQPNRCYAMSPGGWALLRQSVRLNASVLPRLKAAGQVRKELETVVESFVMTVAGRPLPPIDFLAADSHESAYRLTKDP